MLLQYIQPQESTMLSCCFNTMAWIVAFWMIIICLDMNFTPIISQWLICAVAESTWITKWALDPSLPTYPGNIWQSSNYMVVISFTVDHADLIMPLSTGFIQNLEPHMTMALHYWTLHQGEFLLWILYNPGVYIPFYGITFIVYHSDHTCSQGVQLIIFQQWFW